VRKRFSGLLPERHDGNELRTREQLDRPGPSRKRQGREKKMSKKAERGRGLRGTRLAFSCIDLLV